MRCATCARMHPCLASTRIAIGAWGGSAGGHLVSLLGVTDGDEGLEGDGGYPGVSSRVQAVVDMFGPTDLTVPFEGTG